jgi:phenylpyruvate tautomerase PptA (4-oxalocrotonate tautomerase family)
VQGLTAPLCTCARVLDTPAERIRVVVNEVDPDLWGIGGVPYSVVRGASATKQRSGS